jgi:DNA-binding beta-propeller fold protein YncE
MDDLNRLGYGLLALLIAFAVCAFDSNARPAKTDPDNFVFVGGVASKEIVAIDTRTDRIFARYSVPKSVRFLLVARDQRQLVVVTGSPGQIHFLDIDTAEPVGSVAPGFHVTAIQLAPDGKRLAVSGTNQIVILNLVTLAVERELKLDSAPASILFDKSGEFLLIGDAGRGRIYRANLQNGRGILAIDLDERTGEENSVVHLARTPGGSTGLVLHGTRGASVLDLKTNSIARYLDLPGRHERTYPTGNSQYFIIPNVGDGTVSIVSTWTHKESVRLNVGSDVMALNTVLADTLLIGFSRGSATAAVFDLNYRRRLRDISLPGNPTATATGPNGDKVYVAIGDSRTVATINVHSLRVVNTLENVGFTPNIIANSGRLSYCH